MSKFKIQKVSQSQIMDFSALTERRATGTPASQRNKDLKTMPSPNSKSAARTNPLQFDVEHLANRRILLNSQTQVLADLKKEQLTPIMECSNSGL